MILGLSYAMAFACVGIVLLGSAVQGTLGIGMGMVASPLLALADRDFIPGAIVIAVIPLTVGIVVRERSHVDHRGAGLALIGRVPGVIIGSAAVALTGPRFLAVLVATSVLVAVAASVRSVRFSTTPRTLVTAGLASGFTGTTTGVGGPPMAFVYQHADPRVTRSTLSAFFTVGSLMSVAALTASGSLGTRQWQLAALLVPGALGGLVVAQVFAARLRSERARPLILALCAASAIALLVEEFT
jgi:uncharacterized protein